MLNNAELTFAYSGIIHAHGKVQGHARATRKSALVAPAGPRHTQQNL